jgi:hypothetical protein
MSRTKAGKAKRKSFHDAWLCHSCDSLFASRPDALAHVCSAIAPVSSILCQSHADCTCVLLVSPGTRAFGTSAVAVLLNRFSVLYSTYTGRGGDSIVQHPAVPQVGVHACPYQPACMQQGPRDGMMCAHCIAYRLIDSWYAVNFNC